MNANEMAYRLLTKVDKIANLRAPGLEDREISYILNSAQDRVYIHLYNPLANRYGTGFEYNEKRRRDLAELITTVHIFGHETDTTGISTDGITYTFSPSGGSQDPSGQYKIVEITSDDKTVTDTLTFTIPIARGLSQGDTVRFSQSCVFTGGASPTITSANHGFSAGDRVTFTNAGGALPTEVTTGVSYYIISTNLTSNVFNVSATYGGSGINFAGAGTGTHTVHNYPTIVDVLENDKILVSRDIRAKGTTFVGGLGLSTNQYGTHQSGYILDLPALFLYSVEEKVLTSEETSSYVSVRPITHDYYTANINNPQRRPYKNVVWRMDVGKSVKGYGNEDDTVTSGNFVNYATTPKRIEVITGSTYILDYFIRYIKYPRRIVVDDVTPANQISCELDESIHEMIIDEAAKITSSITDPELYQVKANEANTSE